MDLLNVKDASSVMVFDIRLAESELQIYADALGYLLDNLSDLELHNIFCDEEQKSLQCPSETREFVVDSFRELMTLIKENCRQEFLPERFRQWSTENSGD